MVAATVVLDLDGTVWDSYPWYARLLGVEPDAQRELVDELRSGGNVVHVLRRHNVTRTEFGRRCKQLGRLNLFAGVLDSIVALRDRGTSVGVVTNLPEWIASPMLMVSGLDDLVPRRARSFAANKRRSSAGFLSTLAALVVAPSPAVWSIGDTEVDATASQRLGLSFAWASYGYGLERPAGADAVLDRFEQVLEL